MTILYAMYSLLSKVYDFKCITTYGLLESGCKAFLPRDALMHSAVLRLHVVRLSVCDVGGSGSHRLEILETNCTDT